MRLEPEEVELNYLILAEGVRLENEAAKGKKHTVNLLDADPGDAEKQMDALFARLPKGITRGR